MAKFTSEELINRFNMAVTVWIDYCNYYSPDQLRCKPSPDSWSPGQLIRHIILDTAFHVEQIKAALHDQQFAESAMHPNGLDMLEQNEFPDIRIVGHPGNAFISQPESKEALISALSDLQHDLNQLARKFDFDTASGKSQHPGLGFFSAKEWLQFTEMHMRHHLRQKNRIDEYLRLNQVS